LRQWAVDCLVVVVRLGFEWCCADPSEKIPPQRHHRYTIRGFDGIAQQHQPRNEKDGERLIAFDWAKES
jgi:hypothetical protein